MRIATVSSVMGTGGAEVVADVLVRGAEAAGHDVLLASGPGFRARALAQDGVPHVPLPLEGRRPADVVRAVGRLRRTVRSWRPDLVHAHNVKATVVARAAVGTGVPVVSTMHGVPDHEVGAAARILRVAATQVVAVSDHVASLLVDHGVPASRVSVIENAILPPPIRDRASARLTLGIDPGRPVALVLARMAAQKRQDLLLRAWADVREDAVLLMAGDGPRREELEHQSRELGVGRRVAFLGERTDVDVLLSACDLLVLPTDWEGLPISLLEALGCGVPAVASDVGGVSALADGVRLVPAGSVPALADAVDHLLSDPAARQALAARGRRLVRDRFPAERMQEHHLDLYAHLTGLSRTARPTPGALR